MSSTKNQAAGQKCLKAARGFEKKTFLRWKPDWERASREYESAVGYFKKSREAKAKQMLYEAHLGGAVAHRHLNRLYKSAQHFEKAGRLAAKEQKDFKACHQHFKSAAACHADNLDRKAHSTAKRKAAETMNQCASVIRDGDVKACLAAYNDAAEYWAVVAQEDSSEEKNQIQFCDTTFTGALNFCVANEMFKEAADFLSAQQQMYMYRFEEFEFYIHQKLLCITLMYFKAGDFKAAEEEHKSHMRTDGYAESKFGEAQTELFNAVFAADAEAFDSAMAGNVIRTLPDAVVRAVRRLSLPQAIVDAGPRPGFTVGPADLQDFLDGKDQGEEEEDEEDEDVS